MRDRDKVITADCGDAVLIAFLLSPQDGAANGFRRFFWPDTMKHGDCGFFQKSMFKINRAAFYHGIFFHIGQLQRFGVNHHLMPAAARNRNRPRCGNRIQVCFGRHFRHIKEFFIEASSKQPFIRFQFLLPLPQTVQHLLSARAGMKLNILQISAQFQQMQM